jgi:uncharacterized protein (DUF849 family)
LNFVSVGPVHVVLNNELPAQPILSGPKSFNESFLIVQSRLVRNDGRHFVLCDFGLVVFHVWIGNRVRVGLEDRDVQVLDRKRLVDSNVDQEVFDNLEKMMKCKIAFLTDRLKSDVLLV